MLINIQSPNYLTIGNASAWPFENFAITPSSMIAPVGESAPAFSSKHFVKHYREWNRINIDVRFDIVAIDIALTFKGVGTSASVMFSVLKRFASISVTLVCFPQASKTSSP